MTPNRRPTARGLAIVPALVCLVLVTMLCAAMLKLAHAQRGATRDEERRMQAEWLAESGAARASARLAADAGYRGETWDVPAAALGGPRRGPRDDRRRGRRRTGPGAAASGSRRTTRAATPTGPGRPNT